MRIEQLHYLLELYRTRSFSKAAENVFITQPSLSTAISTLEDELGVKLFERMRSGVYPTPMGEAVVKIAAEMIECENRIYETVNQSQPQDRMRLLTIPAISFGILLQALAKFQKKHPHVNLTMQEFPPSILVSECIRPLSDNPGTFAIGSLHQKTKQALIERLESENIKSRYVFTDRFVCHMSANHPLAEKDTITMADFLAYPGIDLNLLTRKPPDDVYTRLNQLGISKEYTRLKESTNIEVDTLANLKRLVLAGNGIALMPSLIVFQDRDYLSGQLVIRNFSDVSIFIEYYLFLSTLYPLKPMEKDFLEEVANYFASIEPPYKNIPT